MRIAKLLRLLEQLAGCGMQFRATMSATFGLT
jgi:hypothetical protein